MSDDRPGDADRRILFVHAHPDDESSKGAATVARYADEGARVVLVTCTGGEAGEVLNAALSPVAPEDIGALRRAELDRATDILGFAHRYDLGFLDSGWHEDLATVPPGVFGSVDVDEPAHALAEILRRERPHVVVTYPEDGGYPHPDHIAVHRVTMRALEIAEDPAAGVDGEPWRVPKVYESTGFPRARVKVLHELLLELGIESPFEGWEERWGRPREDAIDAVLEVGTWFTRRDDALRAHATQIDPDGFWFVVPRDRELELYPYEAYTRLRSDVDAPLPEDDLFAGLGV